MKDAVGHPCKENLINLDRLEVIEGAFTYVYSLWQRGYCNSKYKKKTSNVLLGLLSIERCLHVCILSSD